LLGLAAIGPPFLWAPPDRPLPAMAVTLVLPAELAATEPAPPASHPAPEPVAQAEPPARPVAMPPPLVPAPEAAPQPVPDTLAPGFDAAAPLGVEAPPAAGGPAPEVAVDSEALRAAYAAQVQRAVTRARVYPRVARDRGLEGRVVFQLVLSPEGGLLASQLLQSAGAMTLDRAALETVRRARYPAAPAGIEAERLPVTVEVVFTGSDR
jgi:protein TonB